jgi:hypothetical protein
VFPFHWCCLWCQCEAMNTCSITYDDTKRNSRHEVQWLQNLSELCMKFTNGHCVLTDELCRSGHQWTLLQYSTSSTICWDITKHLQTGCRSRWRHCC